MNPPSRRDILKRGGALALAGSLPMHEAFAVSDQLAFDATSMQTALQAMGGLPVESAGIVLEIAELSESGAFVPVQVTSRLPGTHEIAIVVEMNPTPLAARFTIPAGTEPFISTRVKLAQSGKVHAVVKADGGIYSACRETSVVVGGCSG
jgi:sulfur-oxidizing protein SoxY